jgi:2-phosphoglycerate kinase
MSRWATVYWLGGAPCAGKSSIVELLRRRYPGLRTYAVDAELRIDQLSPSEQPTLYKWTHTPWQALWEQPPTCLLQEVIAAYREHFALVLADVAQLAREPSPLLVEGNCLLPDALLQVCNFGPEDLHRALWLVPTPHFLRAHYPTRGAWVQEILSQCQSPARALAAWLDRDEAFAAWVTAETKRCGQRLITVDGQLSVAAYAEQAAAHFRAFQVVEPGPV